MASPGAEVKRTELPTGPMDEFTVDDTYVAWQKKEGVRVIEDFAFDNLCDVELGPWERKGGAGAIVNIPHRHLLNDAQIVEITPGGQSEPEHHMYEEMVYILAGRGATSIWLDEKHKRTFEWHEGSLFAIPLNANYQHFNASGTEPAGYIAVTNAPPMMRLFRDDAFIFDAPVSFKGRYSGEDDYFNGNGKLYVRRVWESNSIPNAPDMLLYDYKERGAGNINVFLEMAGNNSKAHMSEFPIGTYKKAHKHGPGAHLLILSGQGFSVLWQDGEEYRKSDWRKGGMVIVPSDDCWHQHYNTGLSRARYLALRPGDMGLYPPPGTMPRANEVVWDGGGQQIEYEDEDPRLHEMFETDLAKNVAPCRMKAFCSTCTGEVGPTNERDT
jgi:quercetin dioxygenase-like cupin family protein